MSLRARLIVGLLAVAAVGLIAAGAVTYAEQRSFLLDRVDGQARAGLVAMTRLLGEERLGLRGDMGPGLRGPGMGAPIGPGPGGARLDQGEVGPIGPPGAGAGELVLPPGTYGELRGADGAAMDSVTVALGEESPARPDLPDDLQPGELTTVGAAGDGPRFRVLAANFRGSDASTVVALPLTEVDETLDRLLLVEALVIGAVLLALAALGWVVVRLGLRPLDRIADTAGAIAAGDLSRRVSPADERTEVGRLGLALNHMLERLERAFADREASEARLRTFLADASHELRTPLSSIRGYAELFRIGAKDSPADTEKSMARIEQEAARMGVLVDDMLVLARLDEPRALAREPVDVAALARDAVDDARATAPDRRIELSADGPAVVSGDPDRLRQVLGNLLRNALAHTPAGTPVEVSVGDGDGTVTMAVRDHGPGLPTTDTDRLFERFWRAEGGRERGRAGAGLGLAIVAGIVEAHGGRVTAEDAPGGGARFAVELPCTKI